MEESTNQVNTKEDVPVEPTDDSVAAPIIATPGNAGLGGSGRFDPRRLRLNPNTLATGAVRKVLATVPIRKPPKQDFFRIHPDPERRMNVGILELESDRSSFIVDPSLMEELTPDAKPRLLVQGITRAGVSFLWPLRIVGEDGRLDDWGRSALDAAERAQRMWVRMRSNQALGAYEIETPLGSISEPEWPQEGFLDLLDIAARGHFIENLDHPVVQALRGLR